MTRTIWKYALSGESTHLIPVGHTVRAVGVDARGTPCVWVEVDPEASGVPISFLISVTGGLVPEAATYLGHFVIPGEYFVGHVWLRR